MHDSTLVSNHCEAGIGLPSLDCITPQLTPASEKAVATPPTVDTLTFPDVEVEVNRASSFLANYLRVICDTLESCCRAQTSAAKVNQALAGLLDNAPGVKLEQIICALKLPSGFRSQALSRQLLSETALRLIAEADGAATMVSTQFIIDTREIIELVTQLCPWLRNNHVIQEGFGLVAELVEVDNWSNHTDRLRIWSKRFVELSSAELTALAFLTEKNNRDSFNSAITALASACLEAIKTRHKSLSRLGSSGARSDDLLLTPSVLEFLARSSKRAVIDTVRTAFRSHKGTQLCQEIEHWCLEQRTILKSQILQIATDNKIPLSMITDLRLVCGVSEQGHRHYNNAVAFYRELDRLGLTIDLVALYRNKPDLFDAPSRYDPILSALKVAQSTLTKLDPLFPQIFHSLPLDYALAPEKITAMSCTPIDQLRERVKVAIEEALSSVVPPGEKKETSRILLAAFFTPTLKLMLTDSGIPLQVAKLDGLSASKIQRLVEAAVLVRVPALERNFDIEDPCTGCSLITLSVMKSSPLMLIIDACQQLFGTEVVTKASRHKEHHTQLLTTDQELQVQGNRVIVLLDVLVVQKFALEGYNSFDAPAKRAAFRATFPNELLHLKMKIQKPRSKPLGPKKIKSVEIAEIREILKREVFVFSKLLEAAINNEIALGQAILRPGIKLNDIQAQLRKLKACNPKDDLDNSQFIKALFELTSCSEKLYEDGQRE